MVIVLGPTPPKKRFPRGRYVRQLVELERELYQWRYSYSLQGIENRVDLLGEVAYLVHEASEALMQLKSK